MIRHTTRLLLIVSLLSSMGAHLAIIQTAAWTRMAITFSKNATVGASLQKTFDGHHPCSLCLKVKKASQSGPSLSTSQIENRLEAVMPTFVPQIVRLDPTWTMAYAPASYNDAAASPDSPPPIDFLA